MNWNFLTFGGGHVNYRRAARRLEIQARDSNMFTKTHSYTDRYLKEECAFFWENHKSFINTNMRGFGKWIWKPYLILKSLDEMSFGEGLCYFDSGCYLNFDNRTSIEKFQEYLTFTSKNQIFAGELFPVEGIYESMSEKTWTRKSVLDFLNLDSLARESNQIQATYIFLIKSENTMNFVREWFENCHVNNYFCLEDGAGENQDDVFVEHRFDQSVFSCLYKKYDFDRYPDESWWGPEWQTLGQDFPIWAMRNRTGKDPFKVTSRTVLDELYPKSKFTLNLADKYLT